MRFWALLVLIVLPHLSFADQHRVNGATEAYNASNYTLAIERAQDALAQGLSPQENLDARLIIAFSKFELWQVDGGYLEELAMLDQDIFDLNGETAEDRFELLNVMSIVQYELGAHEASTQTDVEIIRLGRDTAGRHEDVIFALRNLAVTLQDDSDPMVTARYAALFEFFALDYLAADDPISMEATALTSLALLDAGASARAFERFFSHTIESWDAFSETGDAEFELVQTLKTRLDTLQIEDVDTFFAEVQIVRDTRAAQDAQAAEIGDLLEAGRYNYSSPEFGAALARMKDYVDTAYPEDPWAAMFSREIMKSYVETGNFSRARPYLTGVLTYSAPYAAALGMQVATTASILGSEGGMDDAMFEAIVLKGLAIEDVSFKTDPSLQFELFFFLGQMRERQGAFEAAMQAYQSALALQAQHDLDNHRFFRQTLNGAGAVAEAQRDLKAATGFYKRMLESAKSNGDFGASSAALGALSRAYWTQGKSNESINFARQKLAIEIAREPQVQIDVQIAQVNLATLLLSNSNDVTSEIIDMLPSILAGEVDQPDLEAARITLVETIAILELNPNDEIHDLEQIRGSRLFQNIPNEKKAKIIVGFGKTLLDYEKFETVAHLLTLGYELTAPPSEDYFDLKNIEGLLAMAIGEQEWALRVFREVTDHHFRAAFEGDKNATRHLAHHMSAAYPFAIDPSSSDAASFQNEIFLMAQLANGTTAGGALNEAIAREQSDGDLRDALRKRQLLRRDIKSINDAIARARYSGKSADDLLQKLQDTSDQIDRLAQSIAEKAPDLAIMSGLKIMRVQTATERIRDNEILIAFATSDKSDPDGTYASYAIAVTKTHTRVVGLLSRSELSELAQILRCSAALTDPNCDAASSGQTRGNFVLNPQTSQSDLAFDTNIAHEVYAELIAPFADLVEGKQRIVIVPDSALMAMPFHLLLQSPLGDEQPLRDGQWLIRDHSIEIVPTVSSFVAMRDRAARQGPARKFLGIGDPLIGAQKSGPIDVNCEPEHFAPTLVAALSTDGLNRGPGAGRTTAVADLTALPDTRCELQKIAKSFGPESLVLLHGDATEATIKALNDSGDLRSYPVISFATHGLVAGEIGINDSGLVLTPPELPTARDDGLLTTGEIAALNLDADFVILSACNTASGNGTEDEGLSGMASAFFFAGARSLMVSHWPVYSDAAVELTTRTFDALDNDPTMTRADALRLAMLSLLDDPGASPRQTHPAYWGPFMIVGDGLGL